ncbi:MAG TPA: hypothetical protein VFI28_02975 [Candidatus Limnocylindrales bacterium]|nr:hypothetical protein [Candidatus Limnocylindrales bacterium]
MTKPPDRTDDPVHDADDFGGASSPEPSLVARIDRGTVADRHDTLAGGTAADPLTTPVPDRQETGVEAPLVEGSESAPRSGRADAAGADYGSDPHRDRIGAAASGGAPAGSVDGALEPPPGEDVPGSTTEEFGGEHA